MNDVDVINPGETPTDPNPTPTPTPTPDPEPDTPETPDTPSNPGEGEECPETPDEDIIEDEEAPGLLSANDLLKYTSSSNDQKKF